jgi:hypothetical protein
MNALRKWLGVLFLLIEMNLLGGTIFGFPALFNVLSQKGIYKNEGSQQIKQYQVKILFKKKINLICCFF